MTAFFIAVGLGALQFYLLYKILGFVFKSGFVRVVLFILFKLVLYAASFLILVKLFVAFIKIFAAGLGIGFAVSVAVFLISLLKKRSVWG